MKKLVYGAIAIAAIGMFAACQKDGKYNPKEKIDNVYEESLYTWSSYYNGEWHNDTNYTPKHLTERWTWDGNKLTKITYVYYNWNMDGTLGGVSSEEVVNFTYDGKQLIEVNDAEERMVFTYDGRKLQKAEIFSGSSTPYVTMVFEHDGKKISKINVTEEVNGLWPDKSKPTLGRMERLLLGNMLPDLKPVEGAIAAARKSGAKETVSATIELVWDGDNVGKIVYRAGNESGSETYTYDNKNNPYQGFLYAMGYGMTDGGMEFTNKNNIVKVVCSEPDGKSSSETNYTYTYDGDWPVSCSRIHSDSHENGSWYERETKYYEYK